MYFAYDWITPRGILGNGNPVSALMSNHAFRTDEDGTNLETPFHREGLTPCHYFLQATEISVAQAVQQDVEVVYEMMTTGLIMSAFGRWDNPHHRSLFHNVSHEIKEHCRRGRATILINASYEGDYLMSQFVFDEIYRQAAYERLPISRIVFATGNLRVKELYEHWYSIQAEKPDRLRVAAVPLFEAMLRWPTGTEPQNFLRQDAAKAASMRPKHFMCFNRRAHAHRQILVSQILKNNLLPNFHVSMSKPSTGRYTPRSIAMSGWKTVSETIEDDLRLLEERSPLTVDVNEFLTNHAFTHVTKPYLESYINVITETQYMDNNDELLFVSEKVYKPIVNFQPFIMVGTKYSLIKLREFGYKTFAPFIDESYDIELDPYVRMKMIIFELEKISKLPIEAVDEWYQSIFEEILVPNHKLFVSRDTMADLRAVLIGPDQTRAGMLKSLFSSPR